MRPLPALLLLLTACASPSSDRPSATGTIEVVETDIAPMQVGRLREVRVQEGDPVRAGDTLATLTQPSTAADLSGGAARVAQAEAALRDLRAGARPTEIRAAEAELAAARAEAVRTSADLARVRPLAETGVSSRQVLDAAEAAARMATARQTAAAAALARLRQGARPEELRAAEAHVAAVRSALTAREAVASELVLTAPGPGVVLRRVAEPGEVLQAGEAALTLGDLRRLWTRVYVAPGVARRLRVGARVHGTLDDAPDREMPGRIVVINDRAEFTPRIALTERERADLLFGVKVAFDDSTGALHPGLPITVHFDEVAP